LHTLAFVGLGHKDVALRISRHVLIGKKLSWLSAAITEAGEYGHGLAVQNVGLHVFAIRQIKKLLTGISRERDIPYLTVTQRHRGDQFFSHEGTIGFEHLNSIIGAITDINQAVHSGFGAMDRIAKLLR
jgi:hypothetical protein